MLAKIEVLVDEAIGVVHPHVYGHFIEHLGGCIEGGVCGEGGVNPDVVRLFKRIRPSILRYPGGCFADDYHWRDGVGPVEQRPRTVNIHWGNTIESNRFGTHEFLEFCKAVGAEPYLCGNVGSGSPREMRDWVEYCNYPGGSTLSELRKANGQAEPFGVKYWGVGNENWGCGGHMSPEDYASEYRRFSTYLRDFGDAKLFLIACGPESNNLEWTRRFFTKLFRDFGKFTRIHGYTPHYYCGTAGTATEFTEGQWYELLYKARRMEELVVQQRKMMDEFDPQRSIGLMVDEWGTWHPPAAGRNPAFLWQQSTLRDALVAAMTLDIFHNHADKVRMASIAQAVNVLQALMLVENGKVITTPTYHVYDLYQNHQGGRAVRTVFDAPSITFETGGMLNRLAGLCGSATISGKVMTLTVVNPRLGESVEASVRIRGGAVTQVREMALTHEEMTAHNTFEEPKTVRLSEGRMSRASGGEFTHAFAGQSVTRLEMTME